MLPFRRRRFRGRDNPDDLVSSFVDIYGVRNHNYHCSACAPNGLPPILADDVALRKCDREGIVEDEFRGVEIEAVFREVRVELSDERVSSSTRFHPARKQARPAAIVKRMKYSPAAVLLAGAAFCVTLQASFLPMVHLEQSTLQYYENYVAQFERDVVTPYEQSGRMWLDTDPCCKGNRATFANGKVIVEPRENRDIAGGSIHHFSGSMHINGHTIADVQRIMRDYTNYPKYFRPDVGTGHGERLPDSTPQDEHYKTVLSLIQQTLWIAVSYDSTYDTHYRMLDPHRWESLSRSVSIREWQDPHDAGKGYLPEGDDHGFLWRTRTFWFVREDNGGIDLELDSMTLSRPVPTGFAWWGTKRTRDAVDKMMHDLKNAVEKNSADTSR